MLHLLAPGIGSSIVSYDDADESWKSGDDKWYTKFVKGLNIWLNEEHKWFDYDRWNDVGEAVVNKTTGSALTPAEREANAFSAEEAEKARQWEEYMSSTSYQRQVVDMQKAGVNPALAMGGSASGASTPSSPAPSSVAPASGMNMSDLMSLMMMPLQMKMMKAQIANVNASTRNTDSDTDYKMKLTENMAIINKYLPQEKESNIEHTMTLIGLDKETARKVIAECDSVALDNDLKRIEKVIKQAEADESSAYYKARREFEEANTDKVKSEKAELAIRAVMEGIEANFMKNTNTKMGSSTVVALASALGTLISDFGSHLEPSAIVENFKEFFKDKYLDLDKILDWIDKPKNAPWVTD